MENANAFSVEEINQQEVLRQIPLIIFLGIIGVSGAIGNLLVFIIYKKNYPSSNCRSFVLVLSLVDLFTSLIGIPFEIMFLFWEYNFANAWICKLSVFLNTFPTLTSGFLLLAIAVERYRKVCKPFGWQISKGVALFMCVFSAVLGLAFSWISPVIYGIQTSTYEIYNITVSQCVETDAMKQTVFPILNNIFFAVLFVGALSGIIVMYCFIAAQVKRHHDRKSTFRANRSNYYVDQSEASELTVMSGKVVLSKKISKRQQEKDASDAMFCSSETGDDGAGISVQGTTVHDATRPVTCASYADIRCDDIKTKRKSFLRRVLLLGRSSSALSKTFSTVSDTSSINRLKLKPIKHRKKYRTAYIMFLISLAFIISYLPLLCILLIRTIDSDFVPSLNDSQRTAYKFFLRSYFINCACNPIIYGLFDKRFRKFCKKLICKRMC